VRAIFCAFTQGCHILLVPFYLLLKYGNKHLCLAVEQCKSVVLQLATLILPKDYLFPHFTIPCSLSEICRSERFSGHPPEIGVVHVSFNFSFCAEEMGGILMLTLP
jgi:hypothetical protein